MAKKNSKVLLVVIIILLVAACTFAIPFGFLIGVAVDNLTFSAVPVAIFLLMLGVLVVLLRATFRRMRPPGTRPAAAV